MAFAPPKNPDGSRLQLKLSTWTPLNHQLMNDKASPEKKIGKNLEKSGNCGIVELGKGLSGSSSPTHQSRLEDLFPQGCIRSKFWDSLKILHFTNSQFQGKNLISLIFFSLRRSRGME